MDNEALKLMVFAILSAGSGALIQLILGEFIKWREEDKKPISPKTKRRLSLLFAALVPSALYGFAVLVGWTVYDVATHLAYIVAAFTAQQAVHGETKLPSGADLERERGGV